MTSGQTSSIPEPEQPEFQQPEIPTALQAPNKDPENTVTISRTYKFAGQTMVERKQVLASSAEAKLHRESQTTTETVVNDQGLWRPKRRANPFDISGAKENLVLPAIGPKLNVVEKSKLDWAGFVDREGIKDQLDEAGRAKEGYLGRMDFLNRVEANREEMRTARMNNK